MNIKEVLKNKSTWITITISIIMIIVVSHNDCITITKWALSYLEHFFSLDLNNYAIDYMSTGAFFTNYSLFSISIISLWCLPLYLISMIINIPIVLYTTWIKTLMAIISFLCVGLIDKICRKLNFESDYCKLELLFILSPIVAVYSIGMGQIDGIAVIFMLLGVLFFQKKSYFKMSVVLGISILIKGFSVFAIAVILVYLLSKKIKNIIYAIPIGVIYVGEKIVSEVLVKDYLSWGNYINSSSFLPRVFGVEWNMICPCIGIILLVLFYVYFKGKEENELFCINMCLVMYMGFFLFFDWSPQYLYYMLPFMVIAYWQIKDNVVNAWIMWGSNFMLLAYGILHFNYGYINGMLFSESLLGKMFYWKDYYISNTLDVGIYHYFGIAFKTSWIVCVIVIIVQLMLKGRNKND